MLARHSLWRDGMQEMQANKAIEEFVTGLEYPIAKPAILASARETGLGQTVEEALNKLPEREYADAEDLTNELKAG
jgi:hypothetical protein